MPVLFRDGKVIFRDGKVVFTDDPSSCECCNPPGECLPNCQGGHSTGRVRFTVSGVTNAAGTNCNVSHTCSRANTTLTLPDDYIAPRGDGSGCSYGNGYLSSCPDYDIALCEFSIGGLHRILDHATWGVDTINGYVYASIAECHCQNLTIGGWQCTGGGSAAFRLTVAGPYNCIDGVYVLPYYTWDGPSSPVCDYTFATITLEFIP